MEARGCGEGSRAVWQAGGEDKGRAVFPDVASVLFAAPAPRITAFTLQLKNSPRDNLFSWSSPSCIVFQENGFSLSLDLFHILSFLCISFLTLYFCRYIPVHCTKAAPGNNFRDAGKLVSCTSDTV